MQNKTNPPFDSLKDSVSIIIVAHNHRNYLESCLSSIKRQNIAHEIILVDNCSSDGTVEFVKKNYPEVTVIESSVNSGYGAGNNLGVEHAKGEIVIILNPDTRVAETWLADLILPLCRNPLNITTPKILTYDGKQINTCGNINHFTGLTFTRGFGEELDAYRDQMEVSGISGACFAIYKREFISIGGFDESVFLYNEDSDFSWRAHLLGYAIWLVPSSIVYHDYHLTVSPEKLFNLEKGRYLILRKYYSWMEFVTFAPSLLLAELLTFGYAFKSGREGITSKLKTLKLFWSQHPMKISGDKKRLFRNLCTSIPVDQLTFSNQERVLKVIINFIFNLNYRMIK